MLHPDLALFRLVRCVCSQRVQLGALLALALVIGLGTTSPGALAQSQTEREAKPHTVPHPGAQLWKDVRQGRSGTTHAGGIESGVLINAPGAAWAEGKPWDRGVDWPTFRTTELIPKSAIVLAGVLAVIVLWYLVRGTIRIHGGRSGLVVQRTSRFERYAHWTMAVLFIILAITGLILLLGRAFLLPYFGEGFKPLFGQIAYFSKLAHNYSGPLFPVSILLVFVGFVRHNLYARGDLLWALKGGGFFGAHASAGRFNTGEKAVFWLTMALGTGISVTGVMLDFPAEFLPTRGEFQEMQVLHAMIGIGFIGLIFGHIYLATLGVEGTLEAMTQGTVDANWAESHHDRWFEEVKDSAVPADSGGRTGADGSPAGTAPQREHPA